MDKYNDLMLLVKQTAPQYTVEDIFKSNELFPVFLLSKNKTLYVMKSYFKGKEHLLRNEIIGLERASGYKRIPEIIKEIRDVLGYSSLIKTYISGMTLDQKVWSRSISVDELVVLKEQSIKRVKDMHSRGIYGLDIDKQHNVLISPDNKFCGVFEFDASSFIYCQELVKQDFVNSNQIFDRAISMRENMRN